MIILTIEEKEVCLKILKTYGLIDFIEVLKNLCKEGAEQYEAYAIDLDEFLKKQRGD